MMYCITEDCNNPVENQDTGLCPSCGRKQRKQQEAKPKKVYRIPSVSKKQKKAISEYSKAKAEFFNDPKNRICRVCKLPGADSIHHSRGRIGSLLTDQRYFIPIHSFNVHPQFGCSCHEYIETHPEYAKEIEVTKSRL
jgi:hypothetical protein